jgi:hypothetical protein
MQGNEEAKAKVVATIAGTTSYRKVPKAKYRVGDTTVHVRFRSKPKGDGVTHSFNINPNTLSADFELWICGSEDNFYLIPMSELKDIYDHPNVYRDYRHPDIRVLDVNTKSHRCTFGRNSLDRDFGAYFRATLAEERV